MADITSIRGGQPTSTEDCRMRISFNTTCEKCEFKREWFIPSYSGFMGGRKTIEYFTSALEYANEEFLKHSCSENSL